MSKLKNILQTIFLETIDKLIISNQRKKQQELPSKIIVRQKQIKDKVVYQWEEYVGTQVFHVNMQEKDVQSSILKQCEHFKQIDCFTENNEYSIKFSSEDNVVIKSKKSIDKRKINLSHNREKTYLLKDGDIIPPLIDLGVLTKDGNVVKSKYDKFKQINRFIEMIEDGIGNNFKELNIIDFGCGKSYLTFILYYYLTEVKNIKTNIIGLDLKQIVIKNCNEIAQKYGYSNLHFELGDIAGYKTNFNVDMVITLHACDTATDHAIYNAIKWNAKMIYTVPCCQHEFNRDISSEKLSLLFKYGIVKERVSALATDAVRGALLESNGYKTQLLEFIDIEHSPKNILIRAFKGGVPKEQKEKSLLEVKALIDELNVKSTLYELLFKD